MCLPLTRKKNPKYAPMEHPQLPKNPLLGTPACDIEDHDTKLARRDDDIRLEVLKERDTKAVMGHWDGTEYMNKVNWPASYTKKGNKLEMYFSFLERTARVGSCSVVARSSECQSLGTPAYNVFHCMRRTESVCKERHFLESLRWTVTKNGGTAGSPGSGGASARNTYQFLRINYVETARYLIYIRHQLC